MAPNIPDDSDLATRRSTAVIRFVEGTSGTQLENLSNLFERHRQEGVCTFLIDLDGVSYISSTALARLVQLKKKANDENHDFQLINVSHHIHEILRTTRLLKFFFGEEA